MYLKKILVLLFASLLIGCGGGSGDNFQLRSETAQHSLNKITLYAETEGTSSAPTIEDYILAGVVGVTNENLSLLNQKVSNSYAIDADNPRKIEQILINQDFDGDGINDLADNCPFTANAGQNESNSNGIGDECDNSTPILTDNTLADVSDSTTSVFTETTIPVVTENTIPVVTDTNIPVVTDTAVPVVTDTTVPVVTDTTVPVVTDTTVPVVTDIDTSAPVITTLGNISLSLSVGDIFNDPGATAHDNVDGNLTDSIRVNSNVNTLIAGNYRVLYSVDDKAGNAAQVKRRSVVVKGSSPSLSEGIVIPNSLDLIWSDMNGFNTGWTSNMPSSWKQFQGPNQININSRGPNSVNQQNFWFEIEQAGDGSSCSADMNRATNTAVEIGWSRMYYLMNDNTWVLARETKDQLTGGNGGAHPSPGSGALPQFTWGNNRCMLIGDDTFFNEQNANKSTKVMWRKAGEFAKAKPQHYFRYHAWVGQVPLDLTKVKGVFGQTYMRLVIHNPNLPDDRHLANYVGHVGTDSYLKGGTPYYRGGNSVSRYKLITNDWQPFNVYSGNATGATGANNHFTKAQLSTNPPPFRSIP